VVVAPGQDVGYVSARSLLNLEQGCHQGLIGAVLPVTYSDVVDDGVPGDNAERLWRPAGAGPGCR
jgi:hypothetical protein